VESDRGRGVMLLHEAEPATRLARRPATLKR
jgi:hypothetical protein